MSGTKEQCPTCGRFFSRLMTHYDQRNECWTAQLRHPLVLPPAGGGNVALGGPAREHRAPGVLARGRQGREEEESGGVLRVDSRLRALMRDCDSSDEDNPTNDDQFVLGDGDVAVGRPFQPAAPSFIPDARESRINALRRARDGRRSSCHDEDEQEKSWPPVPNMASEAEDSGLVLHQGEDVVFEEDEYDSDISSVGLPPMQEVVVGTGDVLGTSTVAAAVDASSVLRQFSVNAGSAGGGNPLAGVYILDPGNPELSAYDSSQFVETPEFMFRLDLAKLLQDTTPRPPRNFTDKLLKLLRVHVVQEDGVDLGRVPQTNKAWIRKLRKMFGRETLPVVYKVALESSSYQSLDQYANRNEFRDTADVTVWDAVPQVKSLLASPAVFGDISNLVVNQTGDNFDPFAKYVPPDGRLSEVITGEWYDRAWDDMIKRHELREDLGDDKKPPFLIPLMFGMDATGVDAYHRYKTEPLQFTFAIIKRKMRNKTHLSWKISGLMPPLDHKSKNARVRERQGDALSKTVKHGLNTRNYHQ